jgi:hypothetical protein
MLIVKRKERKNFKKRRGNKRRQNAGYEGKEKQTKENELQVYC